MQWKTPRDLSSWVQRSGRAARARTPGLAVMIVRKAAFEASGSGSEFTSNANQRVRTRRRGGGEKIGEVNAAAHKVKRGRFSGKHQGMLPHVNESSEILRDTPKEELYTYVKLPTPNHSLCLSNEIPSNF